MAESTRPWSRNKLMPQPPKIAQWIYSFFARSSNKENTLGDLCEFYDEINETSGARDANRWFWKQAMKSIPELIKSRIYWGGVMFGNNLKIVFRNMINQKLFTSINVFGLALGLAICILSIIYVKYELSFDTYHENADNIFRITRKFDTPSGYNPHFARCPDGWVNFLPDEYPEIESLVRFQWTPSINLKIGENKLRSFKWFITDPNVFDMFSFKLISGDPVTALTKPKSVVITKSIALKHFGDENPMGKEIMVISESSGNKVHFGVTGVMEDLPSNSHFQIEYLASYPNEEARQGWAWIYTILKPGTDPKQLEEKLPEFVAKYGGEDAAQFGSLKIQRLKDIHLYSNLDREIEPNGDIQYVYIFSAAALLILLIACFNFMNLSTAKSAKRAREVGVRKVLGAQRKQLVNYFLWESVIFSLLGFILALLMVIIVFPYFNNLLENVLVLSDLFHASMLIGFLTISLLTGLLSGIYPSAVLSSFDPITALAKGKSIGGNKRQFALVMRRSLVVIQFAISIVLIIFTLVSFSQFNFISEKKLGLDKEQVIAIKNVPGADQNNYPLFKNRLMGNTGVIGVSASSDVPSQDILDQGFTVVEGVHSGEESTILALQSVDENHLELLGMKLIAGNSFPDKGNYQLPDTRMTFEEMQIHISSKEYSYVINESAVKKLGIESPEAALGRKLEWNNDAFTHSGRIVGVVKDFHYASLRLPIRPLILMDEPVWRSNYLIRVSPENIASTISFIGGVWDEIYPDSPMMYDFLDDLFAKLYRSEVRQGEILSMFSLLAIFIALLGLFGLVAYTTEQRTKEIGIRKVMGASVPTVVFLLLKEFGKWLIASLILAIPIGCFITNQWLQNFAYRIEIEPGPYLLASLSVLAVSLVTISFHAVKASVANPIESIKYE